MTVFIKKNIDMTVKHQLNLKYLIGITPSTSHVVNVDVFHWV